MIKAVFFDVDGVLINSDKAIITFFNNLRRELGLKPLTKKEIMKHKGLTGLDWVKKILPQRVFKKIKKDLLKEEFKKEYLKLVFKHGKTLPGVKKVLSILKKKYVLCVITNNYKKINEDLLKHFGLKKYFEHSVTRDDVRQPKPSSEGLRKALKILGIKPSEAVYIGDTQLDATAGRQARIKTIILNNQSVIAWRRAQKTTDVIKILNTLDDK